MAIVNLKINLASANLSEQITEITRIINDIPIYERYCDCEPIIQKLNKNDNVFNVVYQYVSEYEPTLTRAMRLELTEEDMAYVSYSMLDDLENAEQIAVLEGIIEEAAYEKGLEKVKVASLLRVGRYEKCKEHCLFEEDVIVYVAEVEYYEEEPCFDDDGECIPHRDYFRIEQCCEDQEIRITNEIDCHYPSH